MYNELSTIELVIENTFRKPKLEDVRNNIKIILNQIHSLHLNAIESHLNKAINSLTGKAMIKHLDEAKNMLFKLVNDTTLQFIEQHPIQM